MRGETVDDTFEQCGNVELKATCLVDSFDLGTSLNRMQLVLAGQTKLLLYGYDCKNMKILIYPIASDPVSPDLIRIHSSIGRINIFPLPLSPSFFATDVIALTASFTNSSFNAISSRILFKSVTSCERPRYTSLTGISLPCPLAFVTVN